MIKKVAYLPVRLIAMLAGFICLLNIPFLLVFNVYQKSIEFHFSQYKEYVLNNLTWLIHVDEYPSILRFFEGDGMDKYFYTMTILSVSLLIVILIGMFVATTIMLMPLSFRKRLSGFIDFTTTAPDLLIVFLLQYLVIFLYKTFHIKLFQLYGGNYTEPYFMPIVIVSFVPTIFLVQFLLREFANEEQQDYVLFARAKGTPLKTIYMKHIIRNIIPLLLIHLRTIIWFLLSSIIVVEYLFNIHGYVDVLRSMYGTKAISFVFGFLLFAVPVIIANIIAKIVMLSKNRKGTSSI
ncbi:ABC transporter permease subunit [Bacillus sp. 1P10SD]|uniref:ABC transporter permease subunit n=1 Tax=Bacillus sp. 1P10SD TaxID=3132265 RepID=UPI0039A72EDB